MNSGDLGVLEASLGDLRNSWQTVGTLGELDFEAAWGELEEGHRGSKLKEGAGGSNLEKGAGGANLVVVLVGEVGGVNDELDGHGEGALLQGVVKRNDLSDVLKGGQQLLLVFQEVGVQHVVAQRTEPVCRLASL